MDKMDKLEETLPKLKEIKEIVELLKKDTGSTLASRENQILYSYMLCLDEYVKDIIYELTRDADAILEEIEHKTFSEANPNQKRIDEEKEGE